jgi:hypothetical protein
MIMVIAPKPGVVKGAGSQEAQVAQMAAEPQKRNQTPGKPFVAFRRRRG